MRCDMSAESFERRKKNATGSVLSDSTRAMAAATVVAVDAVEKMVTMHPQTEAATIMDLATLMRTRTLHFQLLQSVTTTGGEMPSSRLLPTIISITHPRFGLHDGSRPMVTASLGGIFATHSQSPYSDKSTHVTFIGVMSLEIDHASKKSLHKNQTDTIPLCTAPRY